MSNYDECETCQSITDCKHCGVDVDGRPIPPNFCKRIKKVEQEIKEYYERREAPLD